MKSQPLQHKKMEYVDHSVNFSVENIENSINSIIMSGNFNIDAIVNFREIL